MFDREGAIDELMRLVGDGRTPRPRLVRLAGESGIGKSTVIAALRPALWARGVSVFGGKYEQLRRAGPYSAFAQAFLVMLRWILAQDEAEVARWRARITVALAPNTQVLLDLLPEYERLLGPQPPVPNLGLSETRIRINLVARRFVAALAAETPLVILLDDLQWADDASLDMIETLVGDGNIANLTVLAIYRDNEVDAQHPATLLFARIGSQAPLSPPVELRGLSAKGVEATVREALGGTDRDLGRLPALVHRKTQGNPLFVRQFVATLLRKGLVEVDADGTVRFDAKRLTRERLTDNVVDLVIERIVALPPASREMVEIAACCLDTIGRTDLADLSGLSASEVDRALEATIAADVLTPTDMADTLVFQHDRVREGAYALVPVERRGAIHAALAASLQRHGIEGGRMRMLHADHLLAGRDYLTNEQTAELRPTLLDAAEAARRGNAHGAALTYLDAALEIERSFDARLRRIEILYLLGRFGDARHAAEELSDAAEDDAARVAVLRLRVSLATATLNYRDALAMGQEALSLLGERLAIDPSRANLLAMIAAVRLEMRGRTPEQLLDLPPMEDPLKRAAMKMLLEMAPAAYFASQTLLPAIALRMVRLSLRHGNAPESAYGYALYGIVQSAVLGDAARGLAFGELARRAVQAIDARELEGNVAMIYSGFLLHWTAPLTRTLPLFLDGAERAIEAGDLDNHGYLRYGHASYAFMAGLPLARVDGFLKEHLEAVERHPHDKTRRIMTMARASVARMRGRTPEPYDEAEYLVLWDEQRDATSLAYYHKYRMLEALMENDYERVMGHAKSITAHLNGVLGMAYQPFYTFYEALAAIELAGSGERSALSRRPRLARAARLTRRLARWTRGGASTWAPRVLLLRAELAAARGALKRAMRLFDEAIGAAGSSQALHDVALFHERYGRLLAACGASAAARTAFSDAVAAYRDWGADGWADRLAERHGLPRPSAFEPKPGDGAALPAAETFAALETEAEVAHGLALALRRHVGATGVSVLYRSGGRERIVALEPDASEPEPVEEGDHLPQMVVNYVLRTREPVLIDHRDPKEPFASDPFWLARSDRDLLCVPLVGHDDVLGAACIEIGDDGAREGAREGAAAIVAQAAAALENATNVQRLRAALDDQVELTSAHARFVPHAFLEVIGRPSIAQVRLGDHQQRPASVLFSDIRGFTARLEALAPEDAMTFVNGYLSLMEPFVQENGGFIDSYVGDAVMAVFDRGPEAAVRAASAMNKALRKWRGVKGAELSEPLRIGVGIASGDLIFGTLGAANRMKCGVVGDVVNLAARIEGLTTGYGCAVLATRESVAALPPDLERWTRLAGWTHVKGREAPVCLAEIFHAEPDEERERKRATRDVLRRFTDAQDTNRPEEARAAIADAAKRFPEDALVRALHARFGWDNA